MIKVYNKLVRDRIPEIIEASGKHCKTAILSEEEYLKMLDAKLDEELAEYHSKSLRMCEPKKQKNVADSQGKYS